MNEGHHLIQMLFSAVELIGDTSGTSAWVPTSGVHDAGASPAWTQIGFDDATWPQGEGGFGTDGTPGARVATRWDAERLQVRTRFALTEIPAGLILGLHHDEDVVVSLNGVEVLARSGYRSDI